MAQDETVWGTDTPISLPVPPQDDVLIDMGPFGYTQFGLVHNLSRGDLENFIPTYLPVSEDG